MFSLTRFIAAISLPILVAACSDGSNSSDSPPPMPPPPLPQYGFSEVDTRFEQFVAENEVFDGISHTIVDAEQGVVHEGALGDHTLDIIVMLASTSKMPSASLMMALDNDASIDYEVEAPIGTYLPWEGLYGDRTTVQLVSNTSGIPGLAGLGEYGAALCQFLPSVTMEECNRIIYQTEVPGVEPAGELFSYGGSQWQLAGAVAENVANSSWNQAFYDYIGEPCGLEVFEYGNPWSNLEAWTGTADSLNGRDNPQVEGGAISNMSDYAKILLMQLRGGKCGDNQVIAADGPEFMQVDRGGELGVPYGMGWWIDVPEDGSEPFLFYDPGAFGAISWLDISRGIGGYVAVDDYTRRDSGAPIELVREEIIPMVQRLVDEARAAAGQ